MRAYSTDALRVGVFRCPPSDALWRETNDNIGARPHVVFPRTTVGLERSAGRVLATPNDVVFYRPHETYRRQLRDPRGDIALFVAFAPEHLAVPDAPAGPSDSGCFLLSLRLVAELERGGDALAIEDTAAQLVDRALRGWRELRPAARRAATRRGRVELAEAAKDLLVSQLARPLSLGALAAELHVSPFHLSRVFREQTGSTLSGYLHGLRVRAAAQRLADEPGLELTRLAHDLGYCSLSHFTDRFRAAFGAPPSQLRKNMEAAAPAPS